MAAGSVARAASIEGSSVATSMPSAVAVSSAVAYSGQSSLWVMAGLIDAARPRHRSTADCSVVVPRWSWLAALVPADQVLLVGLDADALQGSVRHRGRDRCLARVVGVLPHEDQVRRGWTHGACDGRRRSRG
jgi:hypothetical protein